MGDENWKLLTVHRSGTVSLIKGLSEAKAKELAKSLHWIDDEGTPRYRDDLMIRTEAFE